MTTKKVYPTNNTDYMKARNQSEYCRHLYSSLKIMECKHAPTKTDLGRVWQRTFCPACGAIKFYYLNSNGLFKATHRKE
jgi:hypothetical protein